MLWVLICCSLSRGRYADHGRGGTRLGPAVYRASGFGRPGVRRTSRCLGTCLTDSAASPRSLLLSLSFSLLPPCRLLPCRFLRYAFLSTSQCELIEFSWRIRAFRGGVCSRGRGGLDHAQSTAQSPHARKAREGEQDQSSRQCGGGPNPQPFCQKPHCHFSEG